MSSSSLLNLSLDVVDEEQTYLLMEDDDDKTNNRECQKKHEWQWPTAFHCRNGNNTATLVVGRRNHGRTTKAVSTPMVSNTLSLGCPCWFVSSIIFYRNKPSPYPVIEVTGISSLEIAKVAPLAPRPTPSALVTTPTQHPFQTKNNDQYHHKLSLDESPTVVRFLCLVCRERYLVDDVAVRKQRSHYRRRHISERVP